MPDDLLQKPFNTLDGLVRGLAAEQPLVTALICDDQRMTYAELDRLMDRVAASLQRDRITQGESIAICAGNSIFHAAIFLGAARAGVVTALLPPLLTPDSLLKMLEDCAARALFLDPAAAATLAPVRGRIAAPAILIDGPPSASAFEAWLVPEGTRPKPAHVLPRSPLNIIYSSGTTGAPKGVVQPAVMRWLHAQQGRIFDGPALMLISTPLYTTGASTILLMTLGSGGTAVLMRRFEAHAFLELAQAVRATHAALTPVQYRRILAAPEFDRFDLSSFKMTYSMAAPSSAGLKAEILRRWPGGLTEIYGATEGGACVLRADLRPDKLHTVGRPGPHTELRVIDDAGVELPVGDVGEIVAHTAAIMTGYHNHPELTAEAEWRDAAGRRYFRTGDIGRLDDEGFLTLLDRKKDMIISGGFKVYPSDLEEVLRGHDAVLDAAVVAAPSERWGETPLAFVVLRSPAAETAGALLAWANARLGKTQRLSEVRLVEDLPRNPLGKVLKRELRQRLGQEPV